MDDENGPVNPLKGICGRKPNSYALRGFERVLPVIDGPNGTSYRSYSPELIIQLSVKSKVEEPDEQT